MFLIGSSSLHFIMKKNAPSDAVFFGEKDKQSLLWHELTVSALREDYRLSADAIINFHVCFVYPYSTWLENTQWHNNSSQCLMFVPRFPIKHRCTSIKHVSPGRCELIKWAGPSQRLIDRPIIVLAIGEAAFSALARNFSLARPSQRLCSKKIIGFPSSTWLSTFRMHFIRN